MPNVCSASPRRSTAGSARSPRSTISGAAGSPATPKGSPRRSPAPATPWAGSSRRPATAQAREQAIRELGRISGYIETMVGALEHHLDGRKLAGVKRRLEQLRPGELHECVVSGRKPMHIERLASAEGYFRALADGLRT